MRSFSQRRALVALGLAAQVAVLTCSPSSPTDPGQTTGQIRVTVTTTGTGQPSSFTLRLDGGSAQSVAPNGTATFGSLSAGNYEVSLSVAANCSISGSGASTVGVQEGVTSTVTFSVVCSAVPTGAIGVTASTTGSPVDPDGYTLTVDGGSAQAIGINGTRLLADLVVGDHVVELGGVAANCQVQGENPRTLSVTEGQTTQTQFDVVCSATTGLIQVTVTTTGQEIDPDGYTVDLDGNVQQTVDANGSTTFTGVPEGPHELTLSGVAPNCTVGSANPVATDVVAGQTSNVGFSVTCDATVGDLDVSAMTSGSEIDPDGYSVSVDGGASQPLAVDGTQTFPGLSAGDHQVELSGVAANCAVAGNNPRTVTVPAGGTAQTTFDVTCSSTVGAVEVRVATSGQAIDADGYSVVLDGGASTQLVAVNDTVTFGGLAPGNHDFALQNVADNCTVTSANPATVAVAAGATAILDFTVTCAQLTGEIQVNMSTTGTDLDPNGYTVSVDGGSPQSVGINGSRTFTNVVIGAHDVEIGGVASNCAVQGANPRTVTVNQNATTQVNISVVCSATTGQIQVSVTTTGDDLDPDGYTILLDGGAQSRTVATNGSTTFTGIAPGLHSLQLTNASSNCTVTSANPTSTNVTAGSTANASFTVSCVGLTGNLQVTTTTTGQDLDPNGYTVSIDGGTPVAIGLDETKSFLDLPDGSHTVTLGDLAGNCTVSNNPRTVNVPANGTTSTTFSVSCAALKGDLQVSTSTTGEDQDTGYTVSVDGGAPQAIGANSTLTFPSLDDGNHTVLLGGIAGNCSVSGNNPRTVNVPANGTGSTTFNVSCVGLTGDLTVNTSTTGEDLDPDGYTITVDGGMARTIGVNSSTTYLGVADGNHTVAISGLASNCSVSGSSSRTVNVPANGTGSTTFSVTCVGLTGDLQVTTATSGSEQDTDGYTISIDGGAPQAIGNNATQTFPGLADGNHTVQLGGIKSNCAVSGNNPRTVNVPANGTGSTTFSVTCSATTGTIAVTTATSGQDVDNSYTVTLDGGGGQAITGNGSVSFNSVSPGSHDVELTNVAGNCTVNETNPQTVSVTAGNTTNVSFTITCALITGDLRVITATSGSELDPDGYTVTVDGGMSRSLGVNDTTTYVGIADGTHQVLLSGVAANCSVSAANPRNVNVPANGQNSTTFNVTCDATTGTIAVDVSTSGSDIDPDGYTVTLDGGGGKSVTVNGSTSFTSVSPGSHDVGLTGVAANCSVTETNPQNVSVTAGNTTNVSFTVTCAQIVGSVQVSATTTGQDLDTQYTVTLSGGQGSMTLPANGSTTFTNVPVGGYTVTLSGVAGNCSDDDGDNQEPVTVTASTTANVSFSVTCSPTTGSIRVTTTTTGLTIDPDGYSVDVDGGSPTAIAVNDTVTFNGVAPGSHTVTLSGLDGTCSVTSGNNPASPTVTAGMTATVDYAVLCP